MCILKDMIFIYFFVKKILRSFSVRHVLAIFVRTVKLSIRRKKTRNHEILSLISNNEGMVDLLYCTEHTKKKLEYNVTATVVKNQSVQIASYNLIMDISWNRCPPFTKE